MDRAAGVVLGLACGDALGRPVEFRSQGQIAAEYGTLTEMVGHGTWEQPAGTITDDTDQSVCIARSLVECGGFDPADITERFVAWYDSGPFDIGNMMRQSIQALKQGQAWDEAGQQVWEASAEGSNAGNGSVMRCAPLAVAYRDNTDRLAEVSRESSLITHADPRCTYGCAVLNRTVAGYLRDEPNPLASALDQVCSDAPDELVSALAPVADGTEFESLSTSGYVVDSLQTALHDAVFAESAEDAIVTAVNRGGDADTIGAITGAVAGARFGAQDLPERWLSSIDERDELTRLAERLVELEEE
jgi:ADP-ribosyl-[dinitrogen reductase] hydrolase